MVIKRFHQIVSWTGVRGTERFGLLHFGFVWTRGEMSFILFNQESVYKDFQGQLKTGDAFQQSEINILR